MSSIRTKGARFGLALLGAGLVLGAAAAGAAQPSSNASNARNGNFQAQFDDPLSRNLKMLAENPRDEAALMGAGKAALDMGDAHGALAFFGRAEDVMPSDGRVKLAMASALVQLGQPAAALKFFRDALALGVPEAEIAADRGLAWDISGDPRHAQRDYRLALGRRADPELTRRLALSLAISGERSAALQLLEDPLQLRSRAADRTRALILALTGDTEGAARLVQAAMPGAQSAAILPFLARLPSLGPRDKALAVHLGQFPQGGQAAAPVYAQVQPLPPAYTPVPPAPRATEARDERDETPPAVIRTARPAPGAPARIAAAEAREPASGPRQTIAGTEPVLVRPAPARTASRQQSQSEPAIPLWAWSRGELPPVRHAPPAGQPAGTSVGPAAPPPAPAPASRALAEAEQLNSFRLRPAETGSNEIPIIRPAAPASVAPQPPPSQTGRLADLAATLDRLDRQVGGSTARPAGQGRAAALAAVVDRAARTGSRARVSTEPSRHWVQIAHGAERASLPGAFARLKDKAPQLLEGRVAWTASIDSTNKLLVGPFASDRAAQSFVDKLVKADLTAFAWTSDDGQRVERLNAR